MFGTKRSRAGRAVVTGAGSGIGAAFAVELATRGNRVVCSDIDDVAAQRTVDAITGRGGSAVSAHCDVSAVEDVEALAAQAQSWLDGAPTLVVNNAGVGAGGRNIGDIPLEDWHWTLGVNLWGPIHGCHVFTPILREAAEPAGIINVASAASFGAAPGMAAYNVSKAATLSLSETLSAELIGTPIHVTALCPTFVKTNIVAAGRLTAESTAAADRLMRWTGMSPQRVVRTCLDTNDRGGLYCMPQLEARLGWGMKRFAPTTFTRGMAMVMRIGSAVSS
jgi:NAD(P)-dependent dehydrogenase (short-subunit alcohol dehydrogenase family)